MIKKKNKSRKKRLGFSSALDSLELVSMLGWQDILQRYRRSTLGPFWITASMLVMIGTIGVVFGAIFNAPLQDFLPFLAVGMIVWAFISSVINECCLAFISAEGLIKQLPIPLITYVLRVLWRNIIIMGHNAMIVPLVFIFVGKSIGVGSLLFIIGAAIVMINIVGVGMILAVVCTRYRDMPQIISSIMQIAFYLTPVMWMPDSIAGVKRIYLLDLNIFNYLLDIMRGPIIGSFPQPYVWVVSSLSAFVSLTVGFVVEKKYSKRVPYWL